MSALVRVHEGRPTWVIDAEGWHVCVSVHDTWFLQELSRYRKLMIAHARDSKLKAIKDRYLTFLVTENYWYADLKLNPPRMRNRIKLPVSECGFCHVKIVGRTHYGYCNANCQRFYDAIRRHDLEWRMRQRTKGPRTISPNKAIA